MLGKWALNGVCGLTHTGHANANLLTLIAMLARTHDRLSLWQSGFSRFGFILLDADNQTDAHVRSPGWKKPKMVLIFCF